MLQVYDEDDDDDGNYGGNMSMRLISIVMMMTAVKIRMGIMTNENEDDHTKIGHCPTKS